jgi:Rrf2 family protein
MKISQKLEYACRALAQLARRHDGRTLTRLEELAQREDVSANFLVQILNDLRRAGLVASRRGQSGGYLLARSPQKMTLRQVVEAVDPALLQCSVSGAGESGNAVSQAWERISAALRHELDQITVASLASEPGGAMFYI